MSVRRQVGVFILPEIGLSICMNVESYIELYRVFQQTIQSNIPPTVDNVVCRREVKPLIHDQCEFNTDIY